MRIDSQRVSIGASAKFSAAELGVTLGGQKVISLDQPRSKLPDEPQILNALVLPGRGMNVYQLNAYLPGKGVVGLLASPPLAIAQEKMNGGPEDLNGKYSFLVGGAILLPWANVIRGRHLASENAVEARILGKSVLLPANSRGAQPGAEWHSVHGLLLNRRMDSVSFETGTDHASVIGTHNAGTFGGRWLSNAHLSITATLQRDHFGLTVIARNVGSEVMPMGIGWHPYFVLPSSRRQQARLCLPARRRALVNNYDEVFPTGELVDVAESPYDFSPPSGGTLNQTYLDDCFIDLIRGEDHVVTAQLIDPAANYRLCVTVASPEVRAIQVFSPSDKSFVALEPQFNLSDPFSGIWDQIDAGMVILRPDESVSYSVRVSTQRWQ
ncbi:MAG: aldose 1-epimerase [Candidatus Dormibacteraceae bacterium]